MSPDATSARCLSARARLGFPAGDGELQQVTVDYSDLAMRDDAADLCDASRELMRKVEGLVDVGLRVQAEAYELCGRKLPAAGQNLWLPTADRNSGQLCIETGGRLRMGMYGRFF